MLIVVANQVVNDHFAMLFAGDVDTVHHRQDAKLHYPAPSCVSVEHVSAFGAGQRIVSVEKVTQVKDHAGLSRRAVVGQVLHSAA
jgi:hypothetical protein